MIKEAWAKLVATYVFLRFPIIGPIAAWVFYKVAEAIYVPLQNWVNFEIIRFKTEAQRVAYEEAVAAFIQAHDGAGGDPDELQKASDAFDDALAELVHNDVAGDRRS